MKRLFIVFIGILATVCFAVTNNEPKPNYSGIDERVRPIYDRYVELAKLNNIFFTRDATVGFGHIKTKAVGTCMPADTYREIEIDINYWNNITTLQQIELLFHELTHCLCGRNHDYGKGKNYTETTSGEFKDGCPLSIMYPNVLPNNCIEAHSAEYASEMFDRCNPF